MAKKKEKTEQTENVPVPPGLGSLDALFKGMQSKYGKGAISLVGNMGEISNVEWLELSSLRLTDLFGKGLPWGRIIEVYGQESSGKTSLACYLAGQIQKAQVPGKNRLGQVVYLDTEHSLDLEYAKSFGLDVDKMGFSQPDSGEQALNMLEDLIESGEVDCVVVDSVATLTPQSELDGEVGDASVGVQARMMSQALRKINPKMKKDGNHTIVIFINQIRMKIGVMYGNPETTTGGNALKFYASLRIETKKKDYLVEKEGMPPYGMTTRFKTVKNKVAPPFKVCEIDIIYGKGFNTEAEVPSYLVMHNLIRKSGGWYSFWKEGVELAKVQGMDAVIQYLKENPDLAIYYKTILYQILAGTKKATTPRTVVTDSSAPALTEAVIAPVVIEAPTEEEKKELEDQDLTPEEAEEEGLLDVGEELDLVEEEV